jgi:hypothetical protein
LTRKETTVTKREVEREPALTVRSNEALIGIVLVENGEEVTHYFVEDMTANVADVSDVTQAALDAIGAWSDLDWDEMERALDRIRHDSPPTPPFEL